MKDKPHWESFYSAERTNPSKKLRDESNFARLLENFFPFSKFIVDLGAGNGRDSRYFAHKNNNSVLAVDSSANSINMIQEEKVNNLETELLDLSCDEDLRILNKKIIDKRNSSKLPVLIYCRFFLHSIDQSTVVKIMDALGEVLISGDLIASEHRVSELSSYLFGDHFRRPFSNSELLGMFETEKYKVVCDYENYGLSIFNGEDPKIGRFIVERR